MATDLDEIENWRALWRQSRPRPSEIVAARTRVSARSSHRRRIRPTAIVVIVVFCTFLVSAAFGASGLARRWQQRTPIPALKPAVPIALAAARPAWKRRLRKDAAIRAPEPTPTPTVGPKVVAPPTPSAPVSSLELPAAEESTQRQGTAWQRAAEALADGDSKRADSAFGELTQAEDADTRDAARLARAQLWVADGQSERAKAELRDLAAHGATTLIRKRARAALTELAKRSKPEPSGTH